MRGWMIAALLAVWPLIGWGQSREVLPEQLQLSVEVEQTGHQPYRGEMILVTIRGSYRRHITRERVEQPSLDGFSWSQLGPDRWYEERIRGRPVKIFERRMALYPERAGELTIGAFAHHLTLTDEGDEWFEHSVHSEPVEISVAPAPAPASEWFPVRRLRISDDWSNAPDQLAPGEGVLRVLRIEALGAMPGMIPPMPDLHSPSGLIFAHPEKRLVELTPEGPMTYAFWRWTIRPGNDTSAIVEPIRLRYFDTVGRVPHEVTISAQRVAYGTVLPTSSKVAPLRETRLPGASQAVLGGAVFLLGLWLAVRGWRIDGLNRLQRFAPLDPLARQMRRAARAGDARALRRAAALMLARDGPHPARLALLGRLDRAIFAAAPMTLDLPDMARAFTSARSTAG